METNTISIYKDADPIPGLAQALLRLWCRQASVAPIWFLAWGFPHGLGVPLKRQKKKKKKKKDFDNAGIDRGFPNVSTLAIQVKLKMLLPKTQQFSC